MADQSGITNLLIVGKAANAGLKGTAKGKLHGEAQAEDQFSALLSHGQKTKAGTARDEAGAAAKVAGHDDGKKPVGTDKEDKAADPVPVVHATDDVAKADETDGTASNHRPVVQPSALTGSPDNARDGGKQHGLGDVLALLAGNTDAGQGDPDAEPEAVTENDAKPGRVASGQHVTHEHKTAHMTDKPDAKADDDLAADRKITASEVTVEAPADADAKPTATIRADDTANRSQTGQDNRLPLQMAAVLGFGLQKQALAETRDDAIIIRATRADGKGTAETRKLGGDRMETDAAERPQPARTMPGQTEQKTIDLLSPDKDIKPVTARSSKADNSDMAAARLVDVQVLEARRFVGLADSSNVSRLGQAIAEDISAVRSSADVPGLNDLAGNVTSVVHTLKLQMHPDNLGPMTASLRLKGEELSVDVRVETVEAYRQLTADQDNLVKSLKDQGFAVEQVNIQLAPSASADSGSNAGSQQNPNFGNPGRDQSLTGQGQQGQMPGQGRGNQAGQEQGRQDARNPIIDATETARNPAAASGQLYL